MPGRKALLIAGALAGAVVLFLAIRGGRDAGPPGSSGAESARDRDSARAGATAAGAARKPFQDVAVQVQAHERERARTGPGGESMELLEQRLERYQSNLDRYRESTKYPPTSRPIAEQPDQLEPHNVPPRRLPLVGPDGKTSDKALVILRQDYYFLAGNETVTFTVECATANGPVPCEIMESMAMSPGGAKHAEVLFAMDTGGLFHEARFQPATEGFADHHGPIHVEVELRIAGEAGTASFDLEYTARPPAVVTGRVSEKLVKGSLVLGLELQIEKPGRYVIAGRVDDVTGRSFAYVAFNEELPRGRAEAELVVFGKLVLDEKARSPFRLRDVEGFLLKENADPDRELLPTRAGVVHTTREYRDQDFSADEWQSEERQRHLDEFERDVERARKELEEAKR
ncbi:MAG TPA: hypothetical protein VNM90_07625 [Haliangium sp.]|nr:hypothetical protein [Haliangium sp.]